MQERTLKVLELDKILARLSDFAVMAETREKLASLKPYTDIEKARTALSETDEARSLSVRHGRPPLVPLTSPGAALRRTKIGASLSPGELLAAAHVLRISRLTKAYFDMRDFDTDYPLLFMYAQRLSENRAVEQKIFDCIISEDEIDDNASDTLFSIRRKKNSLTNKVKDILNDIIHSSSYSSMLREPIVSMRGDRYVVPVKSEYRSSFKGVVHDTSQTGGTVFIEPLKVVETNNEIRELAGREKEEIDRILAELSTLIGLCANEIDEDFSVLTDIDFVFAKAAYADSIEASVPVLNDKNIIDIKKGRHPLIPPDKVVPVDIRLGEDFDTLVITGPNTGGKTVSLKTLGLFALMAQCGLHIPAKEGSKTAVFSNVFADIGDEQSIEQSLSTFSAHMVNIIEILRKCDSKSLVLFDELGAGTDPAEGAALATAVLKEVKSRGAVSAATTHYSEIKMYAIETPRVENAACEFDVNSLKPTYRLYVGALGKSCAFDIAKKLGMSDGLISDARQLLNAESSKFEDIVNTIETERSSLIAAKAETERELQEARRLREKLQNEDEKRAKNRERILNDARREAKKLLDDATHSVDEKLREIEKAGRQDKISATRRAKQELSSKSGKIDDKLSSGVFKTRKKVNPSELSVGTEVFVPSMQSYGTVQTLPDKNGNTEVAVGAMKLKINVSALELSDKTPEKKKKPQRTVSGGGMKRSAATVKSEIDLRGMYLDDAIAAVDKYIDDAALAHLNTVTIIHGRGTGVLKKGITDYLKSNKTVTSFRLGKYGEGGDGVTVVEL